METIAILAAASMLAALLFRVAPGSDIDSSEMDARLSESTKHAIRVRKASLHQLAGTSLAYYKAVLRGDFGASESDGRPVSDHLRERAPSTLMLVAFGSTVALAVAFAAALTVSSGTGVRMARVPAGLCSCLLALPSGLVVLLAVALGISVELAVILIVAPRLYPYCSRILKERLRSDYILNAHCLGISRTRMIVNHLLPGLAPELGGLFSLSVVSALGVSVAVEVLGARSGLGQLAWRAAMDRDMPVVLAVTMLILLVVRFGTSTSDLLFAIARQQNDEKVPACGADSSSLRIALRA